MTVAWSWFAFTFLCGAIFMMIVFGVILWLMADKEEKSEEVLPPVPAARPTANPLICPAPMVGIETVMKWAIHFHHDRLTIGADEDPQYGIWNKIVERVIEEASTDLGFARHFNFTDMPAQTRKVTAALCLVLDKGLRKNTVEAMRVAHARYDITEREYERFAGTLRRVLVEYSVPQDALDSVRDILDELKPAIVHD